MNLKNKITLQPIFSYKTLIKSLFSRNINNGNSFILNSARSSLGISIDSLLKNSRKIKQILLPDFICSEIIPIINNFDIPITFYSIDEHLNPDINFIEDKIRDKLSIILVVNYFGIPSDWTSLLKLKLKHECIIIEDNAHSLYGEHDNINFGNLGDISFNSLRKILPVLSGSFLQFNININLSKKIQKRFLNFSEFKYSLRSFSRKKRNPEKISDCSQSIYDNIESIDYFSYKIYSAQKEDRENICRMRKSNYNFWLKYLSGSELEMLDIKSSMCPYAFPCIFNDQRVYDKWVKWGIANNVNIIKWPLLPKIKSHRLENTKLSNMLLFPVNHMNALNNMKFVNE